MGVQKLSERTEYKELFLFIYLFYLSMMKRENKNTTKKKKHERKKEVRENALKFSVLSQLFITD